MNDKIDEILEEVTKNYSCTVQQLRSPQRASHLVKARRRVSRKLRQQGMSYPQIGRVLNKDHTTIIHHLRG
jgi:chromosomal replication initiation ATPase DnaA